MRAEDRDLYLVRPVEESFPLLPDAPMDVELVSLDSELATAGRQAERALHGRTQPTRYFSLELRARLLDRYRSAP